MTGDERKQKIESYGSAYETLVRALEQFPREAWHFKPSPDSWSILETVVHITDSEVNSYARCRKLIAEPGSTVMAYDETLWSKALDYAGQSAEDALELFKRLRLSTYNLIKTLPDSTWAHTIEHPENGTMMMDDWLDVYERHVPEHIEQMRRCIAEWRK